MKRDVRTVSPSEFRESSRCLHYIEDGDIIEIEEDSGAKEKYNQFKAMEHIEKIVYLTNISKIEIKEHHRYLKVYGDTIKSVPSVYGSTINRRLDKIEIPKEFRVASQTEYPFWITAAIMFIPTTILIMLGFYGWLILACIPAAIMLVFWFVSVDERLGSRLKLAENAMNEHRKKIEPLVENIIHFETHDIDKARKVVRTMSLAQLEHTLYEDK